MILHSLRTKVLALVGGGLLVATCGITYLAHVVMERMIDRNQQVVYQNELDHLLLVLSQYYTELLNTYQEEVYRDQFQEEALRIIRQNHLVNADDNVYPVILDATGKVLLHPRLPVGDKSLIGLDFIQAMLQSPSGHFKYRYQEEDKWLIFAHFKPWNWVVGYSLKQSYMYADLARFHRILLPVIILVLFTVALVLLYGLKRFLQPIISLTRSAGFIAAGDFSQPIVAVGRDEISVLAGSFESMRKAVEQTIRNMEQQRHALETEVRERQRAEYQAQAAEDRMRVILDSVADAMLVTDPELRVLTF
ncbi:MAG: Cache 3/Cache 2 fusion domain-containing protein, partial [Desulfuromonadaceae bacterium]